MAINANELFAEATRAARPRCWPTSIRPKTFAAGALTLAILTPVARNKATGFWSRWTARETEINLITPTGTVSGGTYTITVNGETTAALAYNADATAIKAALVLLGGIDPEDLTVTGGPLSSGVVTITWKWRRGGQGITLSVTTGSITGGGSIAASESTAGAGDASGDYDIAGFVWPDAIVLNASDEVIGNVVQAGIIHLDDIPIVSGYTLAQLKEGLKLNNDIRKLGFDIQGLVGF